MSDPIKFKTLSVEECAERMIGNAPRRATDRPLAKLMEAARAAREFMREEYHGLTQVIPLEEDPDTRQAMRELAERYEAVLQQLNDALGE